MPTVQKHADPEPFTVRFWRSLLVSGPAWSRSIAYSSLEKLALIGEGYAAAAVAQLFDHKTSEQLIERARITITQLTHPEAISSVWGVWALTRSAALRSILEQLSQPADFPADLFVISRLVLPSFLSSLEKCEAAHIPILIQASQKNEEPFTSRARFALTHLTKPVAVTALTESWLQTRDASLAELITTAGYIARRPPGARVATCLLNNQLSGILSGTADMLDPLIAACYDPDPILAERARQCLPALQSQALIDGLCAAWVNHPDSLLEKAILQARYLPDGPPNTRLLIALKTGRLEIGRACPPDLIVDLFSACRSEDLDINANANICALSLNPLAQDSICALVINNDDQFARQIAIKAGYKPQQPDACALFLFLTEQWGEYQSFDFDQSILRLVFTGANPILRRRLTDKIRSAGRLEFLEILSGLDALNHSHSFSQAEVDTYIRILGDNKQFHRLWQKLVDFTPHQALQVMSALQQAGWRPDESDELKAFNGLLNLNLDPISLNQPFPIAVHSALLRVHGRVNEIAFSPTHPWLAIGTGQRKVVLWNYQTASIHRILTNFEHSIGQIAFLASGTLLIGERSNTTSECRFYAWENDRVRVIGSHKGSITAIEPLDSSRVITAGRDLQVKLWNINPDSKILEKAHNTWARHLIASNNRSLVAILTDTVTTYSLLDFSELPAQTYRRRFSKGYKRSVSRCAAFTRDDKHLLVGQTNGQVSIYADQSLPTSQVILTQHPAPVQQVIFLPERSVVATAGAEGEVRFFDWPSKEILSTIAHSGGRLTSLHISPDGAFLATGSADSAMILWDMRINRLSTWLQQPIAKLTTNDLTTINSQLSTNQLQPALKNLLTWLQIVLQHTYRYDIQIGEAVTIQPGEYDILLD